MFIVTDIIFSCKLFTSSGQAVNSENKCNSFQNDKVFPDDERNHYPVSFISLWTFFQVPGLEFRLKHESGLSLVPEYSEAGEKTEEAIILELMDQES